MQLRRFRFKRGLVRANRVIAVSEATKRDIENVLGIPPERIRRVYNAPDPGFFQRAANHGMDQDRILERYQINYPLLLYAGKISRHINVQRLLEAFAVTRDQFTLTKVFHDVRSWIIS